MEEENNFLNKRPVQGKIDESFRDFFFSTRHARAEIHPNEQIKGLSLQQFTKMIANFFNANPKIVKMIVEVRINGRAD